MADPMSRDAAEQCVDKAKGAMMKSEWELAIRLLERSVRLAGGEIAGAGVLLANCHARVRAAREARAAAAAARDEAAARAEQDARRRAAAAARPAAAPAPAPRASRQHAPAQRSSVATEAEAERAARATPEQVAMVDRAIRARTLWAVLGLEEGASTAHVKRAFRKIALRMHPDKNPAPRAKEAFQKANHAFTVLKDSETRERYMATGDDGQEAPRQRTAPVRRRGGFRQQEQQFGHEDPFDEFVRQAFFGGGGFARQHHFHAHRQAPQQQQQQRGAEFEQADEEAPQLARLLQLLPLLLMLVLALGFLPSTLRSEPSFGFARGGRLTQPFRTDTPGLVRGVAYWVRPDTGDDLMRSALTRAQFERRVQESRLGALRQACADEDNELRRLRWEFQYSIGPRRENVRQRLNRFSGRRCDEYREFAASADQERAAAFTRRAGG